MRAEPKVRGVRIWKQLSGASIQLCAFIAFLHWYVYVFHQIQKVLVFHFFFFFKFFGSLFSLLSSQDSFIPAPPHFFFFKFCPTDFLRLLFIKFFFSEIQVILFLSICKFTDFYKSPSSGEFFLFNFGYCIFISRISIFFEFPFFC